MNLLISLWYGLLATLTDVLPIAGIIFGFQLLVIRRSIPNLKKVLFGFGYVLLGLTLFLQGLEQALFPIGKLMAEQFTANQFLFGTDTAPLVVHWQAYYWVYIFAAAIGFATTIAEPALMAVAIKAAEVSGGGISVWGLRIAVAVGVSVGLSLGVFRIITGLPLQYFIMVGYVIVIAQTFFSPKMIIALAYDSGGVTTSTVTVPLVAALGLGLASTVPGRNPLLDGFGLIAFASLFPIISVMAYAQLAEWREKKQHRRKHDAL